MPLDLKSNKGPIDHTEQQYQDVLEDLQGNILKGHGRNQSVHIFLTFRNPEGNQEKIRALKQWIAQLATQDITSAKKQLRDADAWRTQRIDAGVFVHFAISSSGYQKLDFSDSIQPKGPNLQDRGPDIDYVETFQQGMKLR